MTEAAPFEPTLPVPPAWIEELTGIPDADLGVLCLSYFPSFLQRLGELKCTLTDIEGDFEQGYVLKKCSGSGEGHYFILESCGFRIWVQPKEGKTTSRRLALATKIEIQDIPRPMTQAPLRGICFRPVWDEQIAAPEVYLAYQDACQILQSPAPFEPRVSRSQPTPNQMLLRYSAFAELLEALKSRAMRAPRARVEGTVSLREDHEEESVLRLKASEQIKGFKVDMLVQGSIETGGTFSSRVLDVDGQVIELEAAEIQLPKAGTRVVAEETTRFEFGAHQRALRHFLQRQVTGNWEHLRDLLAAPQELDMPTVPTTFTPGGTLTLEQQEAVHGALSSPHAFFIQGPPGTGKTTVITEIVSRLVERGERVLLLSTTHVAVDEVLRRIEKKKGVLPVRLAWDAKKIEADVRGYAYEHAVRALVKKVIRPIDRPDQFWAELKRRTPSPDSGRFDALREIQERWIAGGRETGALAELEEEIGAALLGAANLICATTVGVANKKFAHVGQVDTLIVDEASRVTDTEFLIGAVRAKRWILVGDEHQLPPHVEPDMEYFLFALIVCAMVDEKLAPNADAAVKQLEQDWNEEEPLRVFRAQSVQDLALKLVESRDWQAVYRAHFNDMLRCFGEDREAGIREILRTLRDFMIQSLFERGVAACPSGLRKRLTQQRRMIEPLARFVRDPVYKGAYTSPVPAELLKCGVEPLVCDTFPTPITFLNTQARGKEAADKLIRTGFVNSLEAQWVIDACECFEQDLTRLPMRERVSVSILCFYSEQATRIRALLAERKRAHQRLQFRVIDAIDRIQGQESDLVLISFCRAKSPRSPLSSTYGMWLRDIRRLNVAFTRARRALVLVGHKPTLERLGKYEPFYSHLFQQFEHDTKRMRMVQDFGQRRRRR